MPEETVEALVEAVGAPTAARVEADLACLQHLLSLQTSRREYLQPILDGEDGAIAELFAAARIARDATGIEPHASGRGRRRCDALVHFGGFGVFVEVKHQRDAFPFNDPGEEVRPGITIHGGSRPGADTRYMDDPAPDTTEALPGATIWRETLEEAAAQLPQDDPGLIIISVDAFGGQDEDTYAALFGDPVRVARPHPQGHGSVMEWRRYQNGVFHDARFSHVAGVWFFRLTVDGADQPPTRRCDWARGHLNPSYSGPSLPDDLTYALPNVIGLQD